MIWTLILKNWRVVGSFLAMAAFLGWVTWQSQQITSLKGKLVVSQASIFSYEESLSALQADTKARIQALEEEKNRQSERTKTQERLLGRIEGASDEQDAPVAPVCCAMLLSACTGAPQTQIKVIKPEVPARLLSCAPAPQYPGDDMTQRDIAENYTRLWFAHKDCKSKLKSIKQALGKSAQAIEK